MTLNTKLKKLINTLLKNISLFEELIGGFYMNEEFLKIEKQLNNMKDALNSKTQISEEKFNNIVNNILPVITAKLNEKIDKYNENQKTVLTETELQQSIIEKAKNCGGFIEFYVNEEQTIKFAKIPFLIWCIGETPYQHGKEKGDILYDIKEQLIKMWGETFSYSGEKSPNDNVYHNEWIRSINVDPSKYYNLVEENDYEYISSFAFHYSTEYQEFLFKGNDSLKFYDFVNKETSNFKYIYNKKDENKSDEEQILKSIPYHINSNTNFPIYFNFITQNGLGGEYKDLGTRFSTVVVKNSDESVNEIALTLCNFNNSIIFTNNPSKTAHLINVAEDINLNIFYLPLSISLDDRNIYKLDRDGLITPIVSSNYELPCITLQNCENVEVPKVKNLAKLFNNGINVPNGFFKKGKKIPTILTSSDTLIARSAGINEGSKKARFSGLFKSKKLTFGKLENDAIIQEVIDSFSSKVAKLYAEKMNVKLPKVGVFYQEFIEASQSFVVKVNNENIYIETTKGDASKLVNGEIIPDVYEFSFEKIPTNFIYKNIVDLTKNIQKILNEKKLELEIVEKNNILYVVQAI